MTSNERLFQIFYGWIRCCYNHLAFRWCLVRSYDENNIMSYTERVQRRITSFVRSTHEQIHPEPTLGLFNFRCYENAVEYKRRYPEMEVVEVIYIDGVQPILHYINRNPVDGAYLETTLGWKSEYLEYYFIRKVIPTDHRYIANEFDRGLNVWLKRFTNWFERNILRVTRVL